MRSQDFQGSALIVTALDPEYALHSYGGAQVLAMESCLPASNTNAVESILGHGDDDRPGVYGQFTYAPDVWQAALHDPGVEPPGPTRATTM